MITVGDEVRWCFNPSRVGGHFLKYLRVRLALYSLYAELIRVIAIIDDSGFVWRQTSSIYKEKTNGTKV